MVLIERFMGSKQDSVTYIFSFAADILKTLFRQKSI